MFLTSFQSSHRWKEHAHWTSDLPGLLWHPSLAVCQRDRNKWPTSHRKLPVDEAIPVKDPNYPKLTRTWRMWTDEWGETFKSLTNKSQGTKYIWKRPVLRADLTLAIVKISRWQFWTDHWQPKMKQDRKNWKYECKNKQVCTMSICKRASRASFDSDQVRSNQIAQCFSCAPEQRWISRAKTNERCDRKQGGKWNVKLFIWIGI